ncbi:maleylpyruvate isomerase family mycothiol-dependent enzyme [Kutzneria chonburiensis]|uniref:Maleylpyruvate isomerase family mycothiol-dependent enzyme n=1 Tax=Kutzneria chonburiensis TaxID=1483604 RepID=A0ABV6N8H1_9PSEU|nr:maleylpyruvate isomerase family mycothiol-dependent enzyme [Kutzneria chonburiensis]
MPDFERIQRRELAALADDLSALDRWRDGTLCADWDVEEVVAHLGAATRFTRFTWFRSMAGARFNADVHNRRRLEEFRGTTPQETLERFRGVGTISLPNRSSPFGLSEVIIHGEDIRRPLGLRHGYDADGLLAVARFLVGKDFAVKSRTLARGLALRATDAEFREGVGPEVHGPLLALVMVLAGRAAFLPDLGGDGLPELTGRLGGSGTSW